MPVRVIPNPKTGASGWAVYETVEVRSTGAPRVEEAPEAVMVTQALTAGLQSGCTSSPFRVPAVVSDGAHRGAWLTGRMLPPCWASCSIVCGFPASVVPSSPKVEVPPAPHPGLVLYRLDWTIAARTADWAASFTAELWKKSHPAAMIPNSRKKKSGAISANSIIAWPSPRRRTCPL